jgi:hypothetical protein
MERNHTQAEPIETNVDRPVESPTQPTTAVIPLMEVNAPTQQDQPMDID